MVLATLSRIVDVSAMEVPFLEVARQMSPVIGGIFAFILLFAVYTTSVPILYGFSVRFAGGWNYQVQDIDARSRMRGFRGWAGSIQQAW